MELSIIIVNWHSREYLRRCIATILDGTHGIDFEIVVIDNASFDGSAEMLRQCHPVVRFIQSERNLGFAKANNAAYLESRGRNLLFLNPDTEVVGPAVTVLLDHLRKLPNAGAVGCRLLNADGTVQTSCIQPFPTILNQALDSELLRARWPDSSLWGNAPLFAVPKGPREVGTISGACLMMSRSVFEKAGFFSEEYFMYGEDIDLCYKARRSGCTNYYVPDASVIHFGGGSTKEEPGSTSDIMMRESVWRFLRKSRGEFYGFGYRLSTLACAMVRVVILSIALPTHIVRPERKSPQLPIRKWASILGWSLGLPRHVRNRRQTQL